MRIFWRVRNITFSFLLRCGSVSFYLFSFMFTLLYLYLCSYKYPLGISAKLSIIEFLKKKDYANKITEVAYITMKKKVNPEFDFQMT